MKKRFLIVCVLFVIGSFSVFASNFLTPTVVDVRSSGMGGSYLCDFKQPFVLLNNPSGMSFSGKQIFLPYLALDMGGPSASASRVFKLMKSSGGESMTDMLVDMLKESNDLLPCGKQLRDWLLQQYLRAGRLAFRNLCSSHCRW